MTRFVVPLKAFRQALLAVKPHADPDTELLSAVRLRPGADPDELQVSASDGYTAAVATVPMTTLDGEADPVDLTPADVDKVLAVFKAPGKGEPEPEIRVELDAGDVVLADVGGLFEGQALTLPAHSIDRAPDVRAAVQSALVAPSWSGPTHGLSNRALTRLALGTKVYGETAFMDLRGQAGARPSLLALVGQRLVVVAVMVRPDVDVVEEGEEKPPTPDEVRATWRRLVREAAADLGRDIDVDVDVAFGDEP